MLVSTACRRTTRGVGDQPLKTRRPRIQCRRLVAQLHKQRRKPLEAEYLLGRPKVDPGARGSTHFLDDWTGRLRPEKAIQRKQLVRAELRKRFGSVRHAGAIGAGRLEHVGCHDEIRGIETAPGPGPEVARREGPK